MEPCPHCSGIGRYIGRMGQLYHFICRSCGLGFNVNEGNLTNEETH